MRILIGNMRLRTTIKRLSRDLTLHRFQYRPKYQRKLSFKWKARGSTNKTIAGTNWINGPSQAHQGPTFSSGANLRP